MKSKSSGENKAKHHTISEPQDMPSKNNNKTTTGKKKHKPTCGKKPQPQTINSDDEILDELYSHDTAFNTNDKKATSKRMPSLRTTT
jgi:hypothetical protein